MATTTFNETQPERVPMAAVGLTASVPHGVGASAALQSSSSSTQPTPVFRPPLFESRQRFILNTLRKHRAREVLEVGCERGRLLQLLAQPEFQTDSFPFHRFPPRLERRLPASHWTRVGPGLLLERLEGLDLDGENLKAAIDKLQATRRRESAHLEQSQAVSSSSSRRHAPVSSSAAAPLRFVPLRAAILQGGLEIYNERFRGIDAIVASEVIEHLHEPVLDAFAPILLGRYRPRLLILTTPNYAFNTHFPQDETQTGIEDPTGRTDRRFRHPDHKFEWDTHEFRDWCERAAERFGYEVEIGSLGVLNLERRPKGGRVRTTTKHGDGLANVVSQEGGGEDEADDDAVDTEIEALMRRANDENRFASQTAVFKRLGKALTGTSTTSSTTGDSRSRSRSTARGSVGLGGTGTGLVASTTATHDTDGVSESDDTRGGGRGRDGGIESIVNYGMARRPSVVSGSESEVGPLQSFASTTLTGLNNGAAPASTAATAEGRIASRPSLLQSRRVSRSRKPENLPWLSSTGAESTPDGAAPAPIDGAAKQPLHSTQGGDAVHTTAASISAATSAAQDASLLTSTGGLDGVTLTPTPSIAMVQHKLLWETEFPAVAPSPSDSPSASQRQPRAKIVEALLDRLAHDSTLLRVPAASGEALGSSPSRATLIAEAERPGAKETVPSTIVEAVIPLWSTFIDDNVRRQAGGSITRLLSSLGLLPKATPTLALRGRDAGAALESAAERDGDKTARGTHLQAEAQDSPASITPVGASSPNPSHASSLRPARDPRSVMASDGAKWELRLLPTPTGKSPVGGEHDQNGAKYARRGLRGAEASDGLVDGDDDGNEEDDEDGDEDSDDEDARDDALFSRAHDATSTGAPTRPAQSSHTHQGRRSAASRTNNDLYLVYYGPEPAEWLASIENEQRDADAVDADGDSARQRRWAELDRLGDACQGRGGWGAPENLVQADKTDDAVHAQEQAGNKGGTSAQAADPSTTSAPAPAPTGWE